MLNTLAMALKKRGPEYVNQFLSENIIITEKLDTYRILFEKVNGELKFFKKDNTELNLIERVLTNVWEDAIIELSIILAEAEIPEGLRFGVAYTPVNKPIRLMYEDLPKYVLTDVTKRHETSNKVLESYDYSEVMHWATEFKLGRPPIIFEGKLSEDQKRKLIDYGSGKYDEDDKLQNIFENGSYSNADIIEGIIIKNDNQLIQIESYEFGLLNEAYQRVENSRDFYDLTLLRINSFMETYSFPLLEQKDSDEAYLAVVCDIFNKYCKSGNISEDLDPNYLTPPSYGYSGNLNLLLFKNKETIEILEEGDKIHEAIFKIMLSSFRKYKRPLGLLNESDIQRFNAFVYFINEKTHGPNLGEPPSLEPQLLNENRSNNIVVGEMQRRIKTDVDNMRVISSVQKAFSPVSPQKIKGKEKCVVYIMDPQPLTTSQLDNIRNISKMWKAPVILSFVQGKRREEGNNFHLSDNLKSAQLESLADDNRELIPAFFSLGSWDIVEVFEFCRPKYEPIAIITDEDKKSELVIQLYFEEEVMGKRLDVERDFNIGEMKNSDQLPAFRAIEDRKYVSFKDLTPSSIWGLFDSMVSEYKKWNGSVPDQFMTNKFE
jgi:hypothetical protein